jgi:tetratricopeptide (TPR) repeat protein
MLSYSWTRPIRSLTTLGLIKKAKLRADILGVTGALLLFSGCYERVNASDRLQRAFQIRKDIYVKHPEHDNDVLLQNSANDYALALLDSHRFDEAEKLFRNCRDHYLAWGPESENPFENSKYYGNFSTVLLWQGDVDKAIKYLKKSLTLTERFFHDKNSLYYRRVFMLGCFLLVKDDLRGALDKHLEVLTKRLELHGKHHEHTILSTYAVGAMYHHIGDLDTAIGYIEQCIECVRNSKWDAAAYARAKYHLAVLYREKGINEDQAAVLEADADEVLGRLGSFAAECLGDVEDKMMILDDLQPTFSGRYTGRNLLRHLQKCLGNQSQAAPVST